MSEILFYACALVAVGGAMAAALRGDLRAASYALLPAGAGMAGLFVLLGVPLAAALLVAIEVVALVLLRRGAAGAVHAAHPAEAAHAAHAAENAEVSEAAHAAEDGQRESSATVRARSATLVIAFVVIASRAVLITRWPLAPSAGHAAPSVLGLPAVSLAHHLVVALVLFGIGVFAATTRRSAAGIGNGIALMHGAVATAVAAAGHFVVVGGDMTILAVLLVAVAAVSAAVPAAVAAAAASSEGDVAPDGEVAERIANTIFAALAGVTLALLAGAW